MEMSEMTRMWCVLRDTQERVTELESRLSLLEGEGDVTLEDWDYDDFQDAEEAFEEIEAEFEEEEDEKLATRRSPPKFERGM